MLACSLACLLLAFPLACLIACRQYGGAIYFETGTLLADASIRFVNNTDSQGGGAIYNGGGSVILYGPYFYDNTPADIRGSVACYSVCEAGFYGNSNGNANISSDTDNSYLFSCPSYDSCEMCPAGTYMTEISSKYSSSIEDCEPCGAGQISARGNASCASCAAGRYASNKRNDTSGGLGSPVVEKATVCVDCPAGYMTSSSTMIMCQACDAGKTSVTGASSCVSCIAGTYSNAGQDGCSNCKPGTYSNKFGASSCIECAAGKVSTNGTGFTACDECA